MTLLTRTDADHIAHLEMTSPGNLNALSNAMIAALHAELDTIAKDDTIRVVILSGAGKAFCAGHDLKEMQADRSPEALKDLFNRCTTLMERIQTLPQPVIAQVHGIATAAGCQLVATCDMAVAANTTKFGVNGVNIGLFCSTPMVALTRNIPRKAAFEILTTGRFIDAVEAQSLGLINTSTTTENLAATTRTLAQTIAAKLPSAVRYGKAAFYAQAQMTTTDAYAFTGDIMVANMQDDATNEGIQAFIEKRKPDWA